MIFSATCIAFSIIIHVCFLQIVLIIAKPATHAKAEEEHAALLKESAENVHKSVAQVDTTPRICLFLPLSAPPPCTASLSASEYYSTTAAQCTGGPVAPLTARCLPRAARAEPNEGVVNSST